jgi:FAD/FMN-containing dehydrogenase
MLTTLTEESLIEDGLISGDSKQESLFWSIRENVPVALMAVSRLRPALEMVDKSASYGKLFKYDISLSLRHMDTLVPHLVENLIAMDYKIYPGGHVYDAHTQTTSFSSNRALGATKHAHYAFQICCFGHAGDQNLHLNMLFRPIMSQPNSEDKPSEFPSSLSSPPPPPPPLSFPASALTMVEIAAIQSDLDVLIYRFTSQARGSISAEHGIGQAKVVIIIFQLHLYLITTIIIIILLLFITILLLLFSG